MDPTILDRSSCGIMRFVPPYGELQPTPGRLACAPEHLRGAALVWWLLDAQRQEDEFERLRTRPFGLPVMVILPPARDIHRTLPLLNFLSMLRPRAVLPAGNLASPDRLRFVLATPPRPFAETVTVYLAHRGILADRHLRREIRRIIDLAPNVASISKLTRRMYTSRRTLGRHLAEAGLPVPSHWLQFARLLHVAVHLQNDSSAIFRIAGRAGYPDGFTMSNQMKRLTGSRPSEVRACLGWEWIVEAWLRREVELHNLDGERYGVRPSSERPATSKRSADPSRTIVEGLVDVATDRPRARHDAGSQRGAHAADDVPR
ncbi:MAG: helix-turn-helix domain-containing protein [Longimicrobiales bacterium]